MKLSVVIVSYNVKYFLEQALISVRKASEGLDAEVWVVDNNSSDASAQMVEGQFPEVRLICNNSNPGFAGANNQGIRRAGGEYILLLNPDTLIAEDTLACCIDFMDAHPEAGGLGVKMIDGSGQFLPESKRGFPTPWVAFCKTSGLSYLFPRSKLFNTYYLGHLPENETHPVEVLSGAFLFMRRSALEKTGLLDESFFMYGEDIDLSYRLIQSGFTNYYFPGTTIIHYKGESTKKGSLNYVRIFYQAMIIFARKHFQGDKMRLFVLMLQTAIYVRAAMTLTANLLQRAYLPILDAAVLFLGLVRLKSFWANYHFRDPDYYSALVVWFNFPLYILIWLVAVFFSGGYDRQWDIRRVVRGILIGAILTAAVYGFLNLEYRSSRALILLGAIWALVSMVGVRFLLHFLWFGNFNLSRDKLPEMAVVGKKSESERVLRLLQDTGTRKRYIGRIEPGSDEPGEEVLGNLLNLDKWVKVFGLRELIFCGKDISYKSTITWMEKLGPRLLYRTVAAGSQSIVGSSSKNTTGELYTLDTRYAIALPENRRNKRVLDIGLAVFLLCSFPVQWLWVRNRLGLIKNAWQVLIGRKTWVGYRIPAANPQLPELRKGVISPSSAWDTLEIAPANVRRLDFLYAKNYKTTQDLVIIFQHRTRLGD